MRTQGKGCYGGWRAGSGEIPLTLLSINIYVAETGWGCAAPTPQTFEHGEIPLYHPLPWTSVLCPAHPLTTPLTHIPPPPLACTFWWWLLLWHDPMGPLNKCFKLHPWLRRAQLYCHKERMYITLRIRESKMKLSSREPGFTRLVWDCSLWWSVFFIKAIRLM